MKNKLPNVCVLIALASAACFAQSSFQGVTPGASTRNDVARSLGPPVYSVSPTLVEYRAPEGIAKVEVEYSEGSVYSERVEVSLVKPASRDALVARFRLPQRADDSRVEVGKFIEAFGSPALVIFTHADVDEASGVTSIGYYSREFYERKLRRMRGTPDIPLLNAKVTSLKFYPTEDRRIPEEARPYGTRFQGAQTSFIAWVLSLELPPPGRKVNFTTEVIVYKPDGTSLSKRQTPNFVEAHWVTSQHVDGFGWRQPGNWTPGIYRVEVFVEGQRVTGGSFEIY